MGKHHTIIPKCFPWDDASKVRASVTSQHLWKTEGSWAHRHSEAPVSWRLGSSRRHSSFAKGWLWPQDTIYFWHLFILSTVQESASTYILQKKWGLEQKKFLPKVTQPESGRTGFRAQVKVLGFLGGSAVKNAPVMPESQEMQFRSLGQEYSLEEGMATHSGILAWSIPWTVEPGRLQSIGSQTVGHDWSNLGIHMHKC